jgi:hypothetical protein
VFAARYETAGHATKAINSIASVINKNRSKTPCSLSEFAVLVLKRLGEGGTEPLDLIYP